MVVVIMGVTGSGKTTLGGLLASDLAWEFADADDFHSAENKDKIHRGVPLTDEDRGPWLAHLRLSIQGWIGQARDVVLACSALKQAYRDELKVGPEVKFVYLKGTSKLIGARLRQRQRHFAGVAILASQFADLEEPTGEIVVDISGSPEQIVADIRARLGLS